MSKRAELPKNWRDDLRQQNTEDQRIKVSAEMQPLMDEATKIPLRNKTQYPIYVEVRTLHLLRGVAEFSEQSVQTVIREFLDSGLHRYLRAPPKRKKKHTNKKSK
jgi:hypothetical protein